MKRNLTMDYIEFPAKDIEATKTFFNELFGWDFTDYGPDYISFNDGAPMAAFTKLTPWRRLADASAKTFTTFPAAGVFTFWIPTATSMRFGLSNWLEPNKPKPPQT